MADADAIQKAYREFLDLMPMTLQVAGLKPADSAKSFTPEQMQARAQVIQNAFKISRVAIREAVRNG